MLGTSEIVVVYYLGFGYVILLGWAACHPDHQLDVPSAVRYLRRSVLVAVVGLLHPALTLAARDIIGQGGVELPDEDRDLVHRQQRAINLVNVLAWLSLVPPALMITLGRM
ncbi:MAG: hypothetical protein ACRD2C_06155 [Acidimicrobiales bacterium]